MKWLPFGVRQIACREPVADSTGNVARLIRAAESLLRLTVTSGQWDGSQKRLKKERKPQRRLSVRDCYREIEALTAVCTGHRSHRLAVQRAEKTRLGGRVGE